MTESSDDHEMMAEIYPVETKRNKRDRVSIVDRQYSYYRVGTIFINLLRYLRNKNTFILDNKF